jgi:hypothetical protein
MHTICARFHIESNYTNEISVRPGAFLLNTATWCALRGPDLVANLLSTFVAHREARHDQTTVQCIYQFKTKALTYDHRLRGPGHPVRSAIHKP